MQKRDAAWMWSEAFVQAADLSINDRPVDAAELSDRYEHCARLARWRHDVEQARKEYLEGRPAQLRDLYDFWCSLRLFRLWEWRSRRTEQSNRERVFRKPEAGTGDLLNVASVKDSGEAAAESKPKRKRNLDLRRLSFSGDQTAAAPKP